MSVLIQIAGHLPANYIPFIRLVSFSGYNWYKNSCQRVGMVFFICKMSKLRPPPPPPQKKKKIKKKINYNKKKQKKNMTDKSKSESRYFRLFYAKYEHKL